MTLPTTSNVTYPAAEGYHVLLTYGSDAGENLYLQLFLNPEEPMVTRTGEAGQQSPDVAANPEDFRPESGRLFSRSRFDGGEGLDFAHRPEPNKLDGRRYWDSRNLDIRPAEPGDPEELRLLADADRLSTLSVDSEFVRIADSTRVFWADGNDVKWTGDLLAGTPTVTSEDPEGGGGTPGAVVGLGALGRTVYAAVTGEGIHTRTWAGVWSHWSDLAATAMWCVKGRVLGAVSNVLYEAAAAAASTVLKTLESNATWTAVVDAGHVILASASDGVVYAFAEEAGTLVLKEQTDMNPGEVVYSMAHRSGLVFLGTAESTPSGVIGRFYVSQVSGNRLRNAQLVHQWGSGDPAFDHTPKVMTMTRDSVWVAAIEGTAETDLWRYHLSTAGFSRHLVCGAATVPRGITFQEDRAIVGTADDVWRADTLYAAQGWLITPLADFYSAASKSWVGVRVDSDTLTAAGSSVKLYYSTDPAAIQDPAHSSWTLALTLSPAGTTVLATEQALTEVTGRYIALKLELNASTDQTASPAVRSISARMFENLEDVVLRLPVNVSDVIERPGKIPLRVPGRGDAVAAALRLRDREPALVQFLRSGERYRGQVESVSEARVVMAARGSGRLVSVVQIRGLEVTS
ncbi:MAG: hypothetical protein ABIJ75_07810 [Actinomycetota bacterium]